MPRLTGLAAAVGLVAAACTTTEEAKRDQMRPWIGQPVRAFAEQHSLVPVGVHPTPEGRTYIFNKPQGLGSCGVTIRATAGTNEYVIGSMTSNCPPGSL